MSSPATSKSGTSSSDYSLDENPPGKFRSLKEFYKSCNFALFVLDPTYFVEVVKKKEYCHAMKEEIAAIGKNETRELVDLTPGKNIIDLKWVLKIRYHADGSIKKYKAQLVVKGYSQQQGIDFEKKISPVAYVETVKILF